MNTDVLAPLAQYKADRYWGVSPESILLYNNVAITGQDAAWDALRRHHDLVTYVTNHRVGWQAYSNALEEIVEDWFSDTTKYLAQYATPEFARQFVLGAAYEAGDGVMRLLRAAQEENNAADPGDRIVLSRRDARSIGTELDIRLLRSLGALRATADGYQVQRDVIRTLYGSSNLTQEQACWAILERICRSLDIDNIETVIPRLLGGFEVKQPDVIPDDTDGSLPIYAGDANVKNFIERLTGDEGDEIFAELTTQQTERAKQLSRATGIRTADKPVDTPQWPLCDRGAAVCAVASQHHLPVMTKWILSNESISDQFNLHRELKKAGFDVALESDLLIFENPYEGPTDPDAVADYESYLEKEHDAALAVATASDRLQQRLEEEWTAQRNALLAAVMQRLDDITTAPTRFVFSMFDPIYHADKYEIEEYVGDSPHLSDEVDRIREWREKQPHDATTFAEQVRETCARPLENNELAPRLRIMSPWVNFTIKEYTALFQRLLANDIQVQLLLRLPDPSDWSDLKRNFITRIGDTRGNLEIRTYTRYKKFKDHTQLRKHKRGEADEDGDTFVSETGVHAKLYVAGGTENGEVLAGSANLMENSFYYNPEAGLHSQHPEVIQTAVDYFDLIWNLAAPDEIDESVFTEKTNFQFYPKVYRP